MTPTIPFMNPPDATGRGLFQFPKHNRYWVRVTVAVTLVLVMSTTLWLYDKDQVSGYLGHPRLQTDNGVNLHNGNDANQHHGSNANLHNDNTNLHNDNNANAPAYHEPEQAHETETKTELTSGLRDSPSLIPLKIWQIMLPKDPSDLTPIDPSLLPDTTSWLAMNPDYAYTLIGPKGGEAFVEEHYADNPRIVETYQNLTHVGMKPDLLRYLVMDIEGGVYTDTDTVAVQPIDDWVPEDLRDQVRLVVGIEFDQLDGPMWADITHPVQFSQWTLAGSPGHPVFQKMVTHVIDSVHKLSDKYKVPLGELKPTSLEVMEATAPAAWTDVLFPFLQQHDPSLKTTRDLSNMTGPTLFGDILILNIDGFGMGQGHSNSTNDGSIPDLALARHLFRGSWREN